MKYLLLFFAGLSAFNLNASHVVKINTEVTGLEPVLVQRTQANGLEFYLSPGAKLQSSHSIHEGMWEDVQGVDGGRYVAKTDHKMALFRATVSGSNPPRPADLHVPDNLDSAKKYPLLFLFHAFQSGPNQALQAFGIEDRDDMFVCNPAGMRYSNHNQARGWNTLGVKAADESAFPWVNDVAYVKALVETITGKYPIDPDRIYAVGHSLGGGLVHRLLEQLSHIFASGISHAGANWSGQFYNGMNPVSAVQILEIRGVQDTTVSYEGGLAGGYPVPGAVESLDYWATALDCDAQWVPALRKLDFVLDFPGMDTEVFVYENCVGGKVEHWLRREGGHSPRINTQLLLDWLMEHPRIR